MHTLKPTVTFTALATAVISVAAILLALPEPALAAPQEQYEQPPVLRLSDTRAAPLAKGKGYTLAPSVKNDGYFNHYVIRTEFGNFEAAGHPMLETRLSEIPALLELNKLSSSKVFMDAAAKSGKALLTAPIDLIEKTYDRVSNPEKLVDTAREIPAGAGRLFNWAASQAQGVYEGVSDALSSDKGGAGDKGNGSSTLDKASTQGQKLALDFIGYSKREREWFKRLRVNPYSSNEALTGEVQRVAGIETAVGTAFKFVPGIGLIPGLGTFNRWYERAEELALYESPEELAERTKTELLSVGVSERDAALFMEHKSYSPWTRRLISDLLAQLKGVTGRGSFIAAALRADDEPTALYFVAVAEMLVARHKAKPMSRLISSVCLPAGVDKQGALYVPLPVDHLVWTKQVATIFRDLKRRVSGETKITSVEIVVRGSVSSMAMRKLTGAGAVVTTWR